MNIRQEIMLDLFTRMAEYIDTGHDTDTALARAAEDLGNALRVTVARATADAMRAAGVKVH